MCVCDLVSVLEIPQSTVSRHLMTLRHLGLVDTRRDGLWINYSVAGKKGTQPESVLALLRACCLKETVCNEDLRRYDKLIKQNAIVRCDKTRYNNVPTAGR